MKKELSPAKKAHLAKLPDMRRKKHIGERKAHPSVAKVDPDEPLSPQEQNFADEFMISNNSTRSYQKFFPAASRSTAASLGCRLLGKPNVKKYIQTCQAEVARRLEISRDRILGELAACAFLDPADLYDEKGNMKNIHDMEPHVRAALSMIETEEIYEGHGDDRENTGRSRKIRLVPKDKMLEMLARMTGLDRPPPQDPQPGDPNTMTHFFIPFDKIRKRVG